MPKIKIKAPKKVKETIKKRRKVTVKIKKPKKFKIGKWQRLTKKKSWKQTT